MLQGPNHNHEVVTRRRKGGELQIARANIGLNPNYSMSKKVKDDE